MQQLTLCDNQAPTSAPVPNRSSKDIYSRDDISPRRELRLSYLGLTITLIATALLLFQVAPQIIHDLASKSFLSAAEQILFCLVALAMIYGNVVYQLTRAGYMRRLQAHAPATPDELAPLLDNAPSLTILIPSYKEDPHVVRRTLLSAALQCYPNKRIVLLIDDPLPKNDEDRLLLNIAGQLPSEIQRLLDPPARELAAAVESFHHRQSARGGAFNAFSETLALAQLHGTLARWYRRQAALLPNFTHSDAFFLQQTFLEPAAQHEQRAGTLTANAHKGGPYPTANDMLLAYQSLAAPFHATLTSFQRKRFLNLSHEANKAMNLNSFIGLLGGDFVEARTPEGLLLQPCGEDATLSVPPSDYLITLDADSTIAPDYALRLIHFAEQPQHRSVAVVQTPYSAEPNPPGIVERIAGATTDIQYLLHQGFTHFNATFWVGANALLRTAALRDIAITETERGHTVRRFIQDRTVIEDTESSVDLASKGWRLYNYPRRLSHSATPADFGSLLIQRRRWANGGLIIFPKLLRYVFAGPQFPSRLREGFFRLHYLVSIALVNIALPILLLFPFEKNLRSVWFPLTCLPYYLLYGRDLVQAGYRITDLLRIYALNLLLVPVNLGGVFTSLHQAWARHKIPFKRTPKIAGRTSAPAGYIIAGYLAAAYCFIQCGCDLLGQRWFHAAFDLLNGLFFAYAIVTFIGLKNGWQDVAAQLPFRRQSVQQPPESRCPPLSQGALEPL